MRWCKVNWWVPPEIFIAEWSNYYKHLLWHVVNIYLTSSLPLLQLLFLLYILYHFILDFAFWLRENRHSSGDCFGVSFEDFYCFYLCPFCDDAHWSEEESFDRWKWLCRWLLFRYFADFWAGRCLKDSPKGDIRQPVTKKKNRTLKIL